MRHAALALVTGLTLVLAAAEAHADEPPPLDVHRAPLPDDPIEAHPPKPYPSFAWILFQLLPSPELAFGHTKNVDVDGNADERVRTAFGLRWQLTPVLWSFGVHRSQPRWRFFVVDPFARHAGSVELSASLEYIGGHVDALVARPGVRVYLPVLERGERLSVSLGTSVYDAHGFRVAYDVGAYVLNGFLGLQVTVAPRHEALATIATLRLRYF
ncbi:MAG: hypothetical protein KIT84_27550 [Labilithrix sp.]|nr:hypothetical protein [Labilithrix sp.]MCW5814814.1 hypothetical protein [Labilithrix sp.]